MIRYSLKSRSELDVRKLSLIFIVLISCICLVLPAALADPDINLPAFQSVWQRADKPVQDGTAQPPRSWLWGPQSYPLNTGGSFLPYYDSPNGLRQVLYFDKTRMELNNPATGLVTNGLLVTELTSGKLQVGDSAFITRRPAYDIPVAGDALNNVGPTFSSFNKVANLNLDRPGTNRTGQKVDDIIDRDGNVGKASAELSGKATYIHFDPVLKHNIPDVFWDFINQKGTIYEAGKLIPGQPIFGLNPDQPWLEATGYPLTDAYWSKVTVAGEEEDVLTQLYQRRVLTFTPSNKPPYDVEAGNVANQYNTWTDPVNNLYYTEPYSSTLNVTNRDNILDGIVKTAIRCETVPNGINGATSAFKCGYTGFETPIFLSGMQPNETIDLTGVQPDGGIKTLVPFKVDGSGNGQVVIQFRPESGPGNYAFNFQGQVSHKKATSYIRLDLFNETRLEITVALLKSVYISPGQVYIVSAFGFAPNEMVNVVANGPRGAKITKIEQASPYGSIYSIFSYADLDKVSPGAPPDGEWTVTAASAAAPGHSVSVNFLVKGS